MESLIRRAIREDSSLSARTELERFNAVWSDSAFIRINDQFVSGVRMGEDTISVSLRTSGNRMLGSHVVFVRGTDRMELSLQEDSVMAHYRITQQDAGVMELTMEGSCTWVEEDPAED